MTPDEWARAADLDQVLTAARAWVSLDVLRRVAKFWVEAVRHLLPEVEEQLFAEYQIHGAGRSYWWRWPYSLQGPMPLGCDDTAANNARRAVVDLLLEDQPHMAVLRAGRAVALEGVYGRDMADLLTNPESIKRAYRAAAAEVTRAQVASVRCLVKHPLDEAGCDPSWRTPTVLALADGVHAGHAFDRLPILADALQDAGCEHSYLLDHFRGPGSHIPGCWFLDLVLGKP